MKKFLGIVVLGLLWCSVSFAADKFVGKWISDDTNSVREIKKDGEEYIVYLLYSGRFFKKYDNEIDARFKKTNLGYKGTSQIIDEDFNESQADSSFKIKKGELITKTKWTNPSTNKKYKWKAKYRRFVDGEKYVEGEKLFGVQIGKNINEYKTSQIIDLGNDMIGSRPAYIIHPPKKHEDFGTYAVRIVEHTDQIYQIYGFLNANSQNLSWGECESLMRPFRGHVEEKYEDKFTVTDNFGYSAKDHTDHFKLLNKNKVPIYELWTACEEGDVGQYIGKLSLFHNDLDKLNWRTKTKSKKTEKKEF